MNLTLDKLIQHLDSDLSWRKKEITKLMFLHNNDNNLIIVKSSILLLYSHWEGYIKNACKQYLIHISDKNIKLKLLTKNFEAINLKGMVNEVYKSNGALTLINEISLINKIHSSHNKKFKVPSDIIEEKNKEFINTKDNLNLKILNSFLEIVGIGTVSMIETREKYIDEELLNQRNAIGHGTKVDPDSIGFNLDIENIKTLKEFIFLLMDHVKDELQHYAENKFYLFSNLNLIPTRHTARNEVLTKKMIEILSIEN
ncbi:MAG: hypothetical protein ACJAT7_003668 [Psychromonas sp.]|jgi:hypothetical protein|uniref:MAE_28990/MAE_18760 family HEPN-like nuclease n=1 Tax=Psychromonas sp. TaxID=1884585 RepID=UPI0039E5095A